MAERSHLQRPARGDDTPKTVHSLYTLTEPRFRGRNVQARALSRRQRRRRARRSGIPRMGALPICGRELVFLQGSACTSTDMPSVPTNATLFVDKRCILMMAFLTVARRRTLH